MGLDLSAYSNLALLMYRTPFIWPCAIHMDENRAGDGVMLRYYFKEETGIPCEEYSDCSVLEMLVSLSERIDDIAGEPGEQHYYKWFHEMLRNLQLDSEDDENFSAMRASAILNNFMVRNIYPDGAGGLFPLRQPYEDQRELSIWDQMSCYINENY